MTPAEGYLDYFVDDDVSDSLRLFLEMKAMEE